MEPPQKRQRRDEFTPKQLLFARIMDQEWIASGKQLEKDVAKIAENTKCPTLTSVDCLFNHVALGVDQGTPDMGRLPEIVQCVLDKGHSLTMLLLSSPVFFPPYSRYSPRIHAIRHLDATMRAISTTGTRGLSGGTENSEDWPWPEDAEPLLKKIQERERTIQITYGAARRQLLSKMFDAPDLQHIHKFFYRERRLLDKGDVSSQKWHRLQAKIAARWPNIPAPKQTTSRRVFEVSSTWILYLCERAKERASPKKEKVKEEKVKEEKETDESDEHLCICCMERPVATMVLPCQHAVACVECSEQLEGTNNAQKCIQCRQPIKQVLIEGGRTIDYCGGHDTDPVVLE